MKLKDSVTFEESKKMLIAVWARIEPPKVDLTLLGGENVFEMVEKHWHGSGNDVLDFSICWLFCYGNSGGVFEKFGPEILILWEKLFDIPYNRFLEFQTSMDNNEIIDNPLNRYLHKRRDKFREKMNDFTFIDRNIRDFLLMSMLYS